jgi:hypothetical protein
MPLSQPSTTAVAPINQNPNLDTFPIATAPINLPPGETAAPHHAARPAHGLRHHCDLFLFGLGHDTSLACEEGILQLGRTATGLRVFIKNNLKAKRLGHTHRVRGPTHHK